MNLTPDPQYIITHLDRIQTLTEQLVRTRGDFVEQQELTERIHREIAAAKIAVSPFILQNLT